MELHVCSYAHLWKSLCITVGFYVENRMNGVENTEALVYRMSISRCWRATTPVIPNLRWKTLTYPQGHGG